MGGRTARYIIILLSIMCVFTGRVMAQAPYIYMQTSKETPFNIRVGGRVTSCAGKDYCIVPDMDAGAVGIDVVFAQNVYPAQHFTVLMPAAGNRQFKVVQQGTSFSLYDLQQRFYIPANNTAEQDHLPAEHIPVKAEHAEIAKNETGIKEPEAVTTKRHSSNAPQFMGDITLSNSHTVQRNDGIQTGNMPEAVKPVYPIKDTVKAKKPVSILKSISKKPVPKAKTEKAKPAVQTKPAPLTFAKPATTAKPVAIDTTEYEDSIEIIEEATQMANKDCPNPMNGNQYDNLYLAAMQKSDQDRYAFLSSNLKYCFSTNQLSLLTKTLNSEEQRYNYLKNAYSHVSDQYNFASLEDLLTTNEWKNKFRAIQKIK